MKQFIEFLSALIQQTGKKAQQHAQIDELLSLIMPPPHLTARVIHGWLIIINNHPPHVRLAPKKLLLTKLLFHQTRLCVFFFFLRQPPRSADCVNLIFQSKGSIHFNE
jgi:hypothetical protein